MNTKHLVRRRLAVVAAMSVVGTAACELVVDFDRQKIDAGVVDASVPDGGTLAETGAPTDSSVEAASDAADARSDADSGDGGSDADAD